MCSSDKHSNAGCLIRACWGFAECIFAIEVVQIGLEVVDVFRSFPNGKPILVDKLEAARKPKTR